MFRARGLFWYPRCKHQELTWDNDFDCEEIFDCSCGDGVVSYYHCPNCDAKVEVTFDCKGDEKE